MTILLEIALKGFLVLAVAAAANLSLRRAAASTRHLVWTLAVITVALLPAAVVLGPRQPLTVAEDSLLAPLAGDFGEDALRRPNAAGSVLWGSAEERRAQPERRSLQPKEPRGASGEGAPATVPAAGPVEPIAGQVAAVGDDDISAASAATPVSTAADGLPVGTLVLAAWLFGTALVILVLLLERVRVSLLARAARPCTRGPVADAFARVCDDAGLRRLPRLRIGKAGAMPMTWGTLRPVVLLPGEAELWTSLRLYAVLRHEVAHVRRRDDLTQIVATLTAALHWFDPLAWLAVRRLRIERELACDDAVLRLGARPSGYARELLCIADEFRNPVASGLAAQSMARRSQLRHRLEAVLEESRDRRAVTPARVFVGALSAVLLAMPLATFAVVAAPAEAGVHRTAAATKSEASAPQSELPASQSELPASQSEASGSMPVPGEAPSPPFAPSPGYESSSVQVSQCWTPGVDRSSRSTTDSDANLRILEWESADCRADLRLQGDLTFNEDFTAIVGISPGGSFVLEHDENDTRRRLELEAGAGGAPQWSWLVDGREQPYDAEAQRWFAGVLVSILRASGIAAEERTAWIYRQQGAEGVFDEVVMMYSNGTKALYLQALLRQDGLDDDDLESVLDVVAGQIDSNSAKGRVLQTLGTGYTDRIVGGALETPYWQAVASIESNSTTNRLLVELVEGQPQDAPIVSRAIRSAASNIDSNTTLASFLRRLQRQYPTIASSGSQAALFWETAGRIDSNSTMRSFLLDIGEGAPVEDPELLPIIFDTAQASIASNSTLADFVRAMERRYPGIGESGPMRDEFWETVGLIDSSSTLSTLLLDLASGKPDDSPMLDMVLEAGDRRIGSSSQKGRFLVSFAGEHTGAARGRLADQVLDAARSIDSRSTRERTLRSLDELGIG